MHHKTESQTRVEISLFNWISGTRKENDGVNLEQPFERRSRQGQRDHDFGADSAQKADHENFLSFSLKTRQSPTTSFIAQYPPGVHPELWNRSFFD